MSRSTLGVRYLPPSDRHLKIHTAFEELPSGGALTVVNDHEPRSLFYEFQADVEVFDADGDEVEQRARTSYALEFPSDKREFSPGRSVVLLP